MKKPKKVLCSQCKGFGLVGSHLYSKALTEDLDFSNAVLCSGCEGWGETASPLINPAVTEESPTS